MKRIKSLLAVILVIAVVCSLAACSFITIGSSEEIPIVGKWRFNMENSLISDPNIMNEFIGNATGDYKSASKFFDKMGSDIIKDIISCYTKSVVICFEENGKCYTECNIDELRESLIEMYKMLFSRMAELSIEDVAEMREQSVEEVESSLNGVSWSEAIQSTAQIYEYTFSRMTNEQFLESIGQKFTIVDDNTAKGEESEYTLTGNRLSMPSTDGNDVVLICSYKNGVLKIDDIEATDEQKESMKFMVFKGLALEKVN